VLNVFVLSVAFWQKVWISFPYFFARMQLEVFDYCCCYYYYYY